MPSLAPGLAPLLTLPIALQHSYITILEMFLWDKPAGLRTFGLAPGFATKTKSLAANQGLYNSFLAAGLFWSAFHPVEEFGAQLRNFFLGCVVAAGVFGGLTANRKILVVQALPAAAVMGAVSLFG